MLHMQVRLIIAFALSLHGSKTWSKNACKMPPPPFLAYFPIGRCLEKNRDLNFTLKMLTESKRSGKLQGCKLVSDIFFIIRYEKRN